MQPLEILRNEHGLIRHFLDNLGLALEHIEKGENPPRQFFDQALHFIKTFTNEFHHIKEEYMMFVRLAQKKDGAIDAEIDTLRQQHERARNLTAAVSAALNGYVAGRSIPTSHLVENLGAYIALLRRHMHKEDHVFFPLVERVLSSEDLEALAVEFEKTRQKAGETFFEDSHKLVVDMGSMLTHSS